MVTIILTVMAAQTLEGVDVAEEAQTVSSRTPTRLRKGYKH